MQTIINFFEDSVSRFGENIYMWEKEEDAYTGTTYNEIRNQVYRFATGLLSLGIQKGDRLALLAEGRNLWMISELGILYTGAINVPLSIKLAEPEEIKFRIDHSGSRMVIVSGQQLKKIRPIKGQLRTLEKIILLDPESDLQPDEIFVEELMKNGDRWLSEHENGLKERIRTIKEDDYANISYTSGTTADPKGIILTHKNYVTNVNQAYTLLDIPPYYRNLLILPWDHSFAHTAGLYSLMGKGASIASVQIGNTAIETLKNIPVNIKEIKPHMLFSVPALAKNFRKNIEKGISAKGKFAEKLFRHALKMAYSYNKEGYNKGRGLQKLKKPLLALYDKILFSKIRENFGGELEYFIGGGALLDIELQRFFYALGIPMYQGYGLSEAAPIISSNSPKKHKLGSSGFLVTPLELKILDENGNSLSVGEKGEIVVKGDNVMAGYWKNEEATRETLKDGWLYTGDMGYMDKDGFLFVLGRFKSLLISDDGEKYSPEGIEEAFTDQSPIIEQCMLYNNQNPYTVALVYPNKETLKKYLAGKDTAGEETGKEALKLIEQELREYRTGGKYGDMFPQRWLPAAVGILSEGFTEENHLMNSTMKIIRGKITEKYQGLIDYLYTSEAKSITHPENLKSIQKLFE
ncbi:MAG: AMP-binding protein [Chlorobi bacterium]|nr:AMP-binding protein [Chlorobiota bacterium]